MSLRTPKRGLAAVALVLALLLAPTLGVPASARWLHKKPTTTVHKKNWVQRHPTLTGIGAGIATHHALKVSAARKKARGQKLNWAERHPTLTGVGVGTATRHIIKKHTPQ